MVMGKFQADASARGAGGSEPKPEEISLLVDGELDAERVDGVCVGLRQAALHGDVGVLSRDR